MLHRRYVKQAAALAALLLGAVASSSIADTLTWTGAGDGSTFNQAQNWNPAQAPAPTSDCVIPAGLTPVVIRNSVTIGSLSLARTLSFDSCVLFAITRDINLVNGAAIEISNSAGCAGLLFDGGSHTIGGTGALRLLASGAGGSLLTLDNAASVSLAAGITVEYPDSATGSSGGFNLRSGSTLTNTGTIRVAAGTKPFNIAGAGTLINSGVIDASGGTLAIKPSSWTNNGQITCNSGSLACGGTWSNLGSVSLTNATWTLGGNFTSLGNFTQSGSRLNVDSSFTGTHLQASPQTGDIHLLAVKLKDVQLSATGGARFLASGLGTIESSSLDGELVFEVGPSTTLKGGFTLLNQATVSVLGTLIFDGPSQSIGGSGVFTYADSSLILRGGNTLTFEHDVRLEAATPTSRGTVALESLTILDFAGTASAIGSGAVLTVSGNGTLQNRGTWFVSPGAKINVQPYAWTNQGVWDVQGGDLSLYGRFSSLGAIQRDGGTITLGGVCLSPVLTAAGVPGAIRLDQLGLTSTTLDSPAGGFEIVGPTVWTSCSIRGSLATTCCTDFTIKNGLTLLEGAEISLRSNFNFWIGQQSLSGQGTVFLMNGGQITLVAGADLTVGPGVSLVYGADSQTDAFAIQVNPSARLTNLGLIRCDRPTGTLDIGSQGTFINRGIIDAVSGRLTIRQNDWVSEGTIRIADALVTIDAAISSLGNIQRNGSGNLRIAGSFAGNTLIADANTGDIAFSDIVFSHFRLEARDGAKFLAMSSYRNAGGIDTSLIDCTIAGALEVVSCRPLIVQDGLHLENALVTFGTGSYPCYGGASFTSACSIDGSGAILLGRVTVSAPLTIGPQVELRSDPASTFNSITLSSPGSLLNQGKILCSSPGVLSISGGAFTNTGTIQADLGELAVSSPLSTSAGICKLAAGATLGLDNLQNSSVHVERTAGTLRMGGLCTDTDITMQEPGATTILSSLSLTGARLSSVPGSRFKVAGGTTLKGCTLAGEMSMTTYASPSQLLTLTDGLTLENNATLLLNAPSPNAPFLMIRFDGTPAGLFGDGTVRWEAGSMTFLTPGTIAPGITLSIPPNAESSVGPISAASLLNQGTIICEKAGAKFNISGTFTNQGKLQMLAGAATLKLAGPLGEFILASGASATLSGTYTVNKPLLISPGAALALGGVWQNESSISAQSAALSFNGTWSNNGSVELINSSLALGGIYAGLGSLTKTNSTIVWGGTFTGPLFAVGPDTGDVLLNGMSFSGTRLQASPGYKFIIGTGTTLSNCVLATDLAVGPCATLNIRQNLTLENHAVISVENQSNCSNVPVTFQSSTVSIQGNGEFIFRTARSGVVLQTISFGIFNIGAGITIRYEPAVGGAAASFAISGLMQNSGVIRSTAPGSTFAITGSQFKNLGTVEAAAGSFTINPTSISNYTANTFTLSGGKWIASGGALSLGARPVRQVAANTEIALASPLSTLDLAALAANAGTMRLGSGSLAIAPVAGAFTNSGIIDLAPGASLSVTGDVQLAGVFRSTVRGFEQSDCGAIFASGVIAVMGRLTGAFQAPFSPVADDPAGHILVAPSIFGSFTSACFDASPALLGITPVLNTDDAPAVVDVVATASSGFAPVMTLQPPASVRAHPNATLTVDGLPTNAVYQWRKNGQALEDGPTPHGSFISGAHTRSLTMTRAGLLDAGDYSALLANDCGTTISSITILTVCPADLNADALVDDADFVLFLASYNILDCADPSMPPLCPGDLNADNLVDDTDFTIFVAAYNELLCP